MFVRCVLSHTPFFFNEHWVSPGSAALTAAKKWQKSKVSTLKVYFDSPFALKWCVPRGSIPPAALPPLPLHRHDGGEGCCSDDRHPPPSSFPQVAHSG